MREVGAGILPVAVEEQVVELRREVVVVGDVALRPADRVVAAGQAQQPLQALRSRIIGVVVERRRCGRQIEDVVDGAVLDREGAVHIGLAGRQTRAGRQPPGGRAVVDADRYLGPGRGAFDAMQPAGGVDDGELAFSQ